MNLPLSRLFLSHYLDLSRGRFSAHAVPALLFCPHKNPSIAEMSQPDIREYLDKPSPCASDIDAQLEAEEKVAATADKTATKVASDKELAEHRADDRYPGHCEDFVAAGGGPGDGAASHGQDAVGAVAFDPEEACRVGRRGTSRVKDGQTVARGNPSLRLAIGQFVGGHPAFSSLDWLRWPPPPHQRR